MANDMRLIDANAAKLSDIECGWGCSTDLWSVEEWLNKQPTIEAEPVVHGRWIRKGNKNECDQCGFFYYSTRADYRRCPMCEAKMDLKDDYHGK